MQDHLQQLLWGRVAMVTEAKECNLAISSYFEHKLEEIAADSVIQNNILAYEML